MLGCEKTRIRLDDWLDGMLSEEAAGEVRDHLAFCEECRELFSRQLTIQSDLASLGKAAERIADASQFPTVQPRWSGTVRIIAAAACLALLIAGGYWAFDRGGSRSERPIIAERPATDIEPVQLLSLGELMVAPVDRKRVEIEGADSCVAVQVLSADPNIHIVWLYGDCATAPAGNPGSAKPLNSNS